MNNKTSNELNGLISQMLKPLQNISLSVIIEGISAFKIRPFDEKDKNDQELLKKLIKVANNTGIAINSSGIESARPNEVGNAIESFVKDQLNKINLNANTPKTNNKKGKSTGYPDIEFTFKNKINYLECKTYAEGKDSGTMRSFYLSPSENFKITQEAHHFLLAFEIYISSTSGTINIYKCKSWKLLSLENLKCDLKYEFNSNNNRLYDESLIITSGKIKN